MESLSFDSSFTYFWLIILQFGKNWLAFVIRRRSILMHFYSKNTKNWYFFRYIHLFIVVSNSYQFIDERKMLLNRVVLYDQELNDIWINTIFSFHIGLVLSSKGSYERRIWQDIIETQKLSLRKCMQWQDKTHLSKHD